MGKIKNTAVTVAGVGLCGLLIVTNARHNKQAEQARKATEDKKKQTEQQFTDLYFRAVISQSDANQDGLYTLEEQRGRYANLLHQHGFRLVERSAATGQLEYVVQDSSGKEPKQEELTKILELYK